MASASASGSASGSALDLATEMDLDPAPGRPSDRAPDLPAEMALDPAPGAASNTASNTAPARAPNTVSDRAPSAVSDTASDTAPARAPNTASNTAPGRAPNTAPTTASGRAPNPAPGRAPNAASDATSHATSHTDPDVESITDPDMDPDTPFVRAYSLARETTPTAAPGIELVTLDNFESKLPRWDSTDRCHLYAVVDIGSNGIRFSISDLSPPDERLLKCVYRERAAIALYDDLNATSDTAPAPAASNTAPAPATSNTAPAASASANASATARSTSNTAPSTSASAPDTSTGAPGTSSTALSTSASAPGNSNAAPGNSNNNTAVGTSTSAPGDNNTAPGIRTSAPGTSDNTRISIRKDFSESAIDAVCHALSRFGSIAEGYGVPAAHTVVFATEAMRRAANAADMLDRIRDTVPSLPVLVLAPEVEALLGAMGARSGFGDVQGIFVDLGGGSLQMTYMDSTLPEYEMAAARHGQSLPVGAARLTQLRKPSTSPASVRTTLRKTLRLDVAEVVAKLAAAFPELGAELRAVDKGKRNTSVDLYLYGGGLRGYGRMVMFTDAMQPYPIPQIDSYVVPASVFADTKKMLRVNETHEGEIFGMSKRRRKQFPAIVDVVDALIAAIPGISTVTFCGGGNCEGALMMGLPRDVRESHPLLQYSNPADDVATAVMDALQAAMPKTASEHDVFPAVVTARLGQLMWERRGESNDANASWALRDAINRDPSTPGVDHGVRALLALALCARWGGHLPPQDAMLIAGLRGMLGGAAAEGAFWAEYAGACAAVLAKVFPACPRTPEELELGIQYDATLHAVPYREQGFREEVHLTIQVAPSLMRGLKPSELTGCFKAVARKHPSLTPGMQPKYGKTIEVVVDDLVTIEDLTLYDDELSDAV